MLAANSQNRRLLLSRLLRPPPIPPAVKNIHYNGGHYKLSGCGSSVTTRWSWISSAGDHHPTGEERASSGSASESDVCRSANRTLSSDWTMGRCIHIPMSSSMAILPDGVAFVRMSVEMSATISDRIWVNRIVELTVVRLEVKPDE